MPLLGSLSFSLPFKEVFCSWAMEEMAYCFTNFFPRLEPYS